jgi:cold shock CspA family protein
VPSRQGGLGAPRQERAKTGSEFDWGCSHWHLSGCPAQRLAEKSDQGTVLAYQSTIFNGVTRGRGYISPDNGGSDLYVLPSDLDTSRPLKKGDRVTYRADLASNGVRAFSVQLIIAVTAEEIQALYKAGPGHRLIYTGDRIELRADRATAEWDGLNVAEWLNIDQILAGRPLDDTTAGKIAHTVTQFLIEALPWFREETQRRSTVTDVGH